MKITNISEGPRGFHADLGVVMLDKGASWFGSVSEAEEKSARATKFFEFSADNVRDQPTSLSGKNKSELLEIAEQEGVKIEDGATNDDIKSAIELHREANP